MTKTKTSRALSKRFSEQYIFKRRLATQPDVLNAFVERDGRINRITPVKDVAILHPYRLSVEDLAYDPTQAITDATIELPRVFITRNQTNWPFRIEYIEQILDVSALWVIVAASREPSSGITTLGTFAAGTTLDMVKIEKPKVVVGISPLGDGRRTLYTENQLRKFEKGYDSQSMVTGRKNSAIIQGSRPDQYIDIYQTNILPTNLTMYNCAFYNRDVAHLYLDSLSEYIKRYSSAHSKYPY